MESLKQQAARATCAAREAELHAASVAKALQSLRAAMDRYQTFQANTGSPERETANQCKVAEKLMSALVDSLLTLSLHDSEITVQAARRWGIARQMCLEMAEAIRFHMQPRLQGMKQ